MPYTVSFLDQKLYTSLSFDADIKFPESSDFVKKFWILKEYKKVSSDLELSESKDSDKEITSSSCFSASITLYPYFDKFLDLAV